MEELSRLSLLIGKDNVEKLSKKRVLVLGLGGVGGYIVESLVRSGIGHIIMIDQDTIDITNINRQVIALHSTIGEKKVTAWEKRIFDILPSCKVTSIPLRITEENIDMIFKEPVDYAIDACDTITTKFSFLKYCLDHNIPFITCMGTGKRLDPSKLKITDLRKTENDPIARILRKKVKEEQIKGKIEVVYSTELPKKIESTKVASAMFVPSSAGIMAASYIVRKLLEVE